MKIKDAGEALRSKIWIIDDVAVTLIGTLCLGYCLFPREFAKLTINLSSRPFPIFIGEAFLFICSILFIIKWSIVRQRIKLRHIILIAYLVFILVKTLYGCSKWGPLAFRHAALFYYPVFATLGYYFYRREFFDRDENILLFLIIFVIFFINYSYPFHILLYLVLMIILMNTFQPDTLKYIMLPLFLFVAPRELFFLDSRTLLVGNLVSIVFIIIALLFISNVKRSRKIIIFVFLTCILFLGVYKLADRVVLKTITNFRQTINLYVRWNNIILEEQDSFKMKEAPPIRVYNTASSALDAPYMPKADSRGIKQTGIKESKADQYEFLYGGLRSQNQKAGALRNVESAVGNSLFRIFIWRDLLADLNKNRPLWGFDFGMPFRSKSIEIMNIASGEWKRDGWIAIHNSYLELIYRAGIVGIAFIAVLFIFLFNMIRQALRLKSLNGILLLGVLIGWLIAAFFMVILEVPYNAIPLWSLFGMTFAYLFNSEKRVCPLKVEGL